MRHVVVIPKTDKSAAHHGLLRLLSYLLQTFSADQAFAEALNQPVRLAVPAKWTVQGSAVDFLIVVCLFSRSLQWVVDADGW